MSLPKASSSARAALALLLTSSALLTATAASAPTPFEIIKGSWGGGGSVTLQGGKSEKLDCTAYYTSSGGGNSLSVALRCAGQSSKFELRSHLGYKGGKVSGSWEERTYNASGDASGVLKPGSLQLQFRGGVSGSMSVAFSSSSQSISISIATSGAGIKGVHLNMRRS